LKSAATEPKNPPTLLTAGGTPSRDDQMRGIIDGMTAKTWKQDRAKALALLAKTSG